MADTDISPAKTWTAETLYATDLNDEFTNVYENHLSKSTAQTITGVKTFTGTYAVPVVIGTLRLWYDTTNSVLRVKHGSNPSNETDGNILIEG